MIFSINRYYHITTLVLCSTLVFTLCFSTRAANFSVRAGQYQQNLILGENSTDISPSGYDLSTNFDITENLIVHLDYGSYSKDKSFLQNNTLDYEKDNWGIGVSYYWQNWAIRAQYSDLNESLDISNDRYSTLVYEEDYQSPGYLVSTGYNFDIEADNVTWFFNISAALQYSDWKLNLKRVERPIENEIFNTGVDKGDTLFSDATFSAARFINISNNNSVYLGGSVGWNHLISGETSIVSRNGITATQIAAARSTSRNRISQSSFSQSVQGDQYGLLSVFVAYNVTDNLSLDFDYSTSFSADENSDGVYVTLGYSW